MSVMPALPPPPTASPPPGGSSPPGAPPGAQHPFQGALEDHWARTATAEGQTEKQPTGDRPGEAREHTRARPPHDLLAHEAAIAAVTPHVAAGSHANSAPQAVAGAPQAGASAQPGESAEVAEAPASEAPASEAPASEAPAGEEASLETALSTAGTTQPVTVQTPEAPAPASGEAQAAASEAHVVPAARTVQGPVGGELPPTQAEAPEHGPSSEPTAPGESTGAAQATESTGAVQQTEAATPEVAPAAQDGSAETTQAATTAPPEAPPVRAGHTAGTSPTSEQTGEEGNDPRSPGSPHVVSAQPSSDAHGSAPATHDELATQPAQAASPASEAAAPQAQPATEASVAPIAAEAPSADLATATAEGTLLDSGVRMQDMIESIHATVALAARGGLAHARIALEPAELGEIHVHLTQTRDGLVARLTADTPEAARALLGWRGELTDSLSSLGTSLLRLDIGSSGEFTAGEQRHEAHEGQGSAGARKQQQSEPTGPETIVAGADPSPGALTGTLVNVLA
jgi:hypothetical protein